MCTQYSLFSDLFSVPFLPTDNPKFTFIDLFAGIGGFRMAMQNLGGKCVFSSEWDAQAQKTYLLNYGEVPFGDITKESTKAFIPDNFDILCAGFPCQAFSKAGSQKGFKDEEILATGLVNKNDKGEFIDRFRKRLMFPIMDVSGKVIAFGGRKLENNEKMAKYINSNENLVHSKKKHLFGLNLAKQSDSKRIILVEGYMDAISLYQRGFDNVVASLGTALTEAQGRMLKKYWLNTKL